MANSSSPAEPGVWLNSAVWPFRILLQSVMTVFTSWLMAVVLAWGYSIWIWPPNTAATHLHAAFYEILSDSSIGGIPLHAAMDATKFTLACAETAYSWVFVMTGIEASYASAIAGVIPQGAAGLMTRMVAQYPQHIQTAMAATQLYGAKVGMLLTATPLLIGVYAVGMVDGLVLRYARTMGGGRESSFIYHRTKFLLITLIGTTAMLIVLLPITLSPRLILPVCDASVLALAVVQWRFYKKYV